MEEGRIRRTVDLNRTDYEKLKARLGGLRISFSRWVRDRVRDYLEAPDDPGENSEFVSVRLNRDTYDSFVFAAVCDRKPLEEYLADLAGRVRERESPTLAKLCREHRARLESAGIPPDFVAKLAAGQIFNPAEVGYVIRIAYVLDLDGEQTVWLVADHQKG